MLNSSVSEERYNFSGHETFPVRYTWLPKALQHLDKTADLFLREDAMIHLGVGKNMVTSIRYWAQAFGLITRQQGSNLDEPTDLGTKLLGVDGWDPYLEDPGTLWFLHWQLASSPAKTSTWYLAFSQWGRDTFTRTELTEWLLKLIEPLKQVRATPGSMKRDVDVFIRTYVPSTQRSGKLAEDSFDSPLVELGLIQEVGKDLYRFAKGSRPTLPDAILTYAVVDYWKQHAQGRQTIGFETLLHGKGSPGAVFKLTENALAERLERLPTTALRFDDTAGMRQLLKTSVELTKPLEILENYYAPSTKKLGL